MATQGIAFRKNGEALSRATSGLSVSNYPTIYGGFIQKGIPESEIKPRENVFTYNAWRALGRQVRRGEHGVKVLTFIDCQRKDEETGQLKERFRRPFSTTVFHISQTDEIPGGARMSTPSFAFPQSLADKYRPRTIADFAGLEKPKKILRKFAANPYPSAWLLSGLRASGARRQWHSRWPRRYQPSFITSLRSNATSPPSRMSFGNAGTFRDPDSTSCSSTRPTG